MRQRVSARGGRFEIERAAPRGTAISVSMPRERSADAPIAEPSA
jgi:glucose-6-phosphate-specific signal transduction histidine kinase